MIVVLAGMDENLMVSPAKYTTHCGCLDKLRPRTDDGDDFQMFRHGWFEKLKGIADGMAAVLTRSSSAATRC